MGTAKDELRQVVNQQADDSTAEDIVRTLIFHVMVQRGLGDSDAGRTVCNAEMGRRIRSLKK